MAVIFLIIVVISLFFDGMAGHVAPMCFASIYILVMAPGTFFGGKDLDKQKLRQRIEDHWHHSDDIMNFIVRYWYSIKYIRSANKRGTNASAMGIGSLLLAAWCFYAYPNWMAIWSLINGCLLWVIGNKVNKALWILNHDQQSPAWDTVCASFLALAEILPDPIYSTFVNTHMPPDRVSNVIQSYKK